MYGRKVDEERPKGNPAVPSDPRQRKASGEDDDPKKTKNDNNNNKDDNNKDNNNKDNNNRDNKDDNKNDKEQCDGKRDDCSTVGISHHHHPSTTEDPAAARTEEEEDLSAIAGTMRSDYVNEVCATVWKRLVVFTHGGKNKYVLKRHHLRKLNAFVRDVRGARMMIREYVIAMERRQSDADPTIRYYDMASQTFKDLDRLTKLQYVLVG